MDGEMQEDHLRFCCDAMLGGLARWLRAAGYDASWQSDIDDWELVRQAIRDKSVLLSSDTGIFKIGIVRDGEVPALLIPAGLKTYEQLHFVLENLRLEVLEPRCMSCGGALVEVAKEQVRDQVPPRTYDWLDHFFQCQRCQRVYWQGTHWQRIQKQLERLQPSVEPSADANRRVPCHSEEPREVNGCRRQN
jgi:uncharacterized protein with PIN domain